MKIIAFAASNSRSSINQQLVVHAANRLRDQHAPEAEVEVLDLNDYEMPLYGIDREEADGVPAAARRFLARIDEADAVLVSFAEHNGTYTVAFKNVLDWASRLEPRIWQGTPIALMATSPGSGGGGSVLAAARAATPYWGGDLRGTLSVPRFPVAFDAEQGVLDDPELAASLDEVLEDLVEGAEVEQAAA